MYIDLIVLIVLMIVVLMFFKRFSSFVFMMAIIEITLRIAAFLKNNLGVKSIRNAISKYLPESMFDIINRYTENGSFFNMALKWAFVVIMIFFLVYIVKIFIRKKKI